MSIRPRPLLAVRLIGPADVVARHKEHLRTHLAESFGEGTVCRTSTRPADYTGEIRVYFTVTRKEVSPHDRRIQHC